MQTDQAGENKSPEKSEGDEKKEEVMWTVSV
jgi:hypothetical protein